MRVTTCCKGAGEVGTITDFQPGVDRIRLHHAVFPELAPGPLDATVFFSNITGNASSASQRILYNTSSGELFYDGDGFLVNQPKVLFAMLQPGLTLSHTDFFIV
jgi:Ca2+-binding RTX toxin-like protein